MTDKSFGKIFDEVVDKMKLKINKSEICLINTTRNCCFTETCKFIDYGYCPCHNENKE